MDDATLPALDEDGYLRDLADWSPDVAERLAREESVALEAPQWEVLEAVRAFHARHALVPDNRALVKLVRASLGAEKGRSVYLMKLFGGRPALTVARIAGLPRPTNCL